MASLDAKENLSSQSASSSGLSASELDPLSLPSGSRSREAILPELEENLGSRMVTPSYIKIGRKVLPWPVLVKRVIAYVRGPSPPLILRPTPLLDRTYRFRCQSFTISVESTWMRLTRRFTRWPLLLTLGAVYIISLAFIVRANWFLLPSDAFISCTAAFWSAKDGCGLDGQDCMPFISPNLTQFRCPAACTSTQLLNIRTVGDQEVVYKPLVVGGGDGLQTFRGDSWVCLAAMQT